MTEGIRPPPGQKMLEILRIVDPKFGPSDHVRARSAGRLIEEATELGLANGLNAQDILGHVVDALHSEALKARTYPTKIPASMSANVQQSTGEICDVMILADYLRELNGVSVYRQEELIQEKLGKLEASARSGERQLVDGLFYRKGAR